MDYENGIYFDMPENDYHAIPRLSASGIKNLTVSPLTFWSRSWMNTEREDKDDEFRLKGRAYHARVCEGVDAFRLRYVYNINKADHADALDTNEQLKAKCKELGLPVSGNKDELIQRILHVAPREKIWANVQAEFAQLHAGKTILPGHWVRDIEVGATFIEKHPTIQHVFTGGRGEVTLLWTHNFTATDGSDRPLAVKMKSRIDYLKQRLIVDFKTYSNPLDMPPSRAITRAVASGQYFLQAAVYYRAVDAIAALTGAEPNDRQFLFVFQGTGDDKMPRARVMPRELAWVDLGFRKFDAACELYVDACEKFGSDPWVVEETPETFADEDFPTWMGN